MSDTYWAVKWHPAKEIDFTGRWKIDLYGDLCIEVVEWISGDKTIRTKPEKWWQFSSHKTIKSEYYRRSWVLAENLMERKKEIIFDCNNREKENLE